MSVSLREMSGQELQSARGKLLGTTDDVLFDPQSLRALGLSVKRHPGALSVVGGERAKWRYVTLSELSITPDGALQISGKRPAKSSVDWDETLILYGLPIVCEDGRPLGKVADARFDWQTGALDGIAVSAGTTADVALGKRVIPTSLLRRFVAGQTEEEPHVLLVANEAADIVYPGGAAATAGAVAARAGEAVGQATAAAGQVAGQVAGAAARGVGHAVASKPVRSVYGRALSAFSGFKRGFQEGLNNDGGQE